MSRLRLLSHLPLAGSAPSMTTITQAKQSLCIEATAGSGKTTLMIDRLTHLLVDRQIPPDQCLAITFTDKAAKEMMDRLVRKLSSIPNITDPLDIVNRLPIGTIHSFCNGMLKKHALLIHQSPNYRILQNLERNDRLIEIIQGLRRTHQWAPPDWLVTCHHTWSTDQFNQILLKAYDNRESISYWLDHGFYDLDQNEPSEFESTYLSICKAFSSACHEFFTLINNNKTSDDWLDYDDILNKSYQLLSNIDWLRHQYQDQFRYIFVDEFQDTSPVQWKIISLLCGDQDPYEHQKLWMVGDRCQAIYGFRGADDKLMQMVLETSHPNLMHQKNTANYRSHPVIIQFINALFTRLFEDQGQPFLPMIPKKDTQQSASIRCCISDDEDQEFDTIKSAIIDYQSQGIPYQEMAILVRKNMDAQRIKSFLNSCKISAQINRGAGLCELDVVQVVICFLIGMLNHDDDVAWLGIAIDILNISEATYQQLINNQHGVYHELKHTPRVIEWEHVLQQGHVLTQLIELIWALPLALSDNDENAISTFLSSFCDYWHARQGNRTDVLRWLSLCIDQPKAMGTQSKEDPQSIHIMTLHAAKGLEFSVVMVPFIHSPFNMGATDPLILSRHLGIGLSIPKKSADNHIRKSIYNNEKNSAILEELRLFYVTLTRAKYHILLTGKALKRKNTSRLSLCLPYLIDNGIDYQFDFPYDTFVKGCHPEAQQQPMKMPNSVAIYSPKITSPPTIWAVSNVLDAITCPKQMGLKKLRPLHHAHTSDQLDGLAMHSRLANALIYKQKSPQSNDPEWLSRLIQSNWYQRIISSGRLEVEKPFEYQAMGQIVRGRFDAIWLCDSSKTFHIYEFKRSVKDPMPRYHHQVNFYAHVVADMAPNYTFNAQNSGIINLTTGAIHSIELVHAHIDDGIALLTSPSLKTRPSACHNCPYAPLISKCSEIPMPNPLN